MTIAQQDQESSVRHVRLWPGVVAVILQWSLWYALPVVLPEATVTAVFGGLLGGLAVLVWWLFFSRTPHLERWSAIALIIAAAVATARILDRSMATGMMGMLFVVYVI